MRYETYVLEYDEYGKMVNKKTYEKYDLIGETEYQYNKNNLLSLTITINYKNGRITKNEYQYNKTGKITIERWLNNDNEETLLKYYEYDKKNRLIKKGEKTASKGFERYWTYEYF
jgi:hypothetical protein